MDESPEFRRRSRFLSVPTALAALFGCTSPFGWNAVCGCAPVWTGVAIDLGGNIKEEDLTPNFVAERTLARTRGQPLYLQTVRDLGPSFDSACTQVMLEIRCTFWLWAKGDELRGIELQFADEDYSHVSDVTGQYVYTKRGGNRG
jgi:hypothetical protein